MTPDPHALDRDLDETFPASDPPAASTPSTATTRTADGEADAGNDVGEIDETHAIWIDLYRVEAADAPPSGGGPVLYGTSGALALLHYLVDAATPARRVRIESVRVSRAQIDSFAIAPAAGGARRSNEARAPADRDGPLAAKPGRFVPSALSPADRDVVWDTAHPDAGALRVVARTTFALDPRLLRIGAVAPDDAS